jgi:N-acetylmuramoyl-L-alanine amidase
MRKTIQRTISLVVLVLSMFPLTAVGAATKYETGQITGIWAQDQVSDSLATYRIGQLQQTPLQGKVIVVDPGHGGSDVGAIGPNSTIEKQVTLTIAQELRKQLVAGGATVIMTRISDRDVAYAGASDKEELQARIDIANRANADLFISIHADAFAGSAGGTTTYFANETGNNMHLAQSVQENMVTQLNLYERHAAERLLYT